MGARPAMPPTRPAARPASNSPAASAMLIGVQLVIPGYWTVVAAKRSAGILLYRRQPALEVLIGRMGGPFWQRRRERNWSIPKGEHGSDESSLAAARREFTEEFGVPVPDVELVDLGSV